eukprot:SAG11_NODE_718_length_7584_cov_10.771009_2_plen_464_part_00
MRRQFQKEIARSSRDDWRTYVEKIVRELEAADDAGDFGRMAECVRKLGGEQRNSFAVQPDAEEPAAVRADRWAEFGRGKFQATTADTERAPMPSLGPAESRQDDMLEEEELNICNKALKRAKACGVDQVPAEAFREEGPLKKELYALVRQIWKEEVVPEKLVEGLFIMLYKGKGKINDRSKYRCICLLNHAYKLLSAVLLRRLAIECDSWLPESQAGFRKARGCPDNIVTLAALFDDVLGKADEAVIVFIDFVAAFDSVSHKLLDEALATAGASSKSRAIFRAIYSRAAAAVRVRDRSGEEVISPSFMVRRGVVQGDICSSFGYIYALALLFMRCDPEGDAQHGVTLRGDLPVWQLTYADDSALVCQSSEEASTRVSRVRLGFRRDGDKEVSQPKTEAMRVMKWVGKTLSTEQEYAEQLCHQCEFYGKGFDSTQGLHRHETGICAADGLPWCTAAAAHKVRTK